MIDPCACRPSGIGLKNTRLYNRNGRHARLFFQASHMPHGRGARSGKGARIFGRW
jgi:hypothetical protein